MPLDSFFQHMAFQRKVNIYWISLLCKKGCYIASMALTAVGREKRTSRCCHICTGGTEGSRWVNIIYTYSTGIVSSAAHHPYQHCLSIYYDVTLTFSWRCRKEKKKKQMHLKYAFSKDSSILQMQKKIEITGKNILSYRSWESGFFPALVALVTFFLISVWS